ncbi:RHBD2 protein, partial [Tricholaema leucomelas]|nr:RHBD2 protein [Tricholaema leucomelas]
PRGGRMAAERRRPPVATAITLLLSVVVSVAGMLQDPADAIFPVSLRIAVLYKREVHRLLTYIFFYEDLPSLACGAVIIWYVGGSFEKSAGTAKHCFLTCIFAILTALLYLLLQAFAPKPSEVEDAKGFLPVAFATLGVTTTRSQMKYSLVLGIRVPVLLVLWLLLSLSRFVPGSCFLGNLCGFFTGAVFGLRYCSFLDFLEPVVSKLDQMLPFRLLRKIPGLKYIPASSEERRALES